MSDWHTIIPGDPSTGPTEADADEGSLVWVADVNGRTTTMRYESVGCKMMSPAYHSWHQKPKAVCPPYVPPQPVEHVYCIRIGDSIENYRWWNCDTEHGSGWRDRPEQAQWWTRHQIGDEIRKLIEATNGTPPELSILPHPPSEPEQPAERKAGELFIAEFILDSGSRSHFTADWNATRLTGSRVNGQAPIRVFPVREVLPGQPDPEKLAEAVREVVAEMRQRVSINYATPAATWILRDYADKLAAALEGNTNA